ncbi:MAG: hypothetical protein ACREGA_00850 [Candidatus Saccharimonadales bacterium]
MNQKNPLELIDDLRAKVRYAENGAAYALMDGDNPDEYSKTDALVTFNPYANRATPHMLVRAEFIREAAKFSDVRDEAGKLKPVIMLASPGLGGSNIKLSREDRKQIRNGDIGPFAKELLQAVSALDIGRVSLLGYSQGADVALAGANINQAVNLDTDRLAIGEPVGVEPRTMPQLGKDFLKIGNKDFQDAMDRSGLEVLKSAFKNPLQELGAFAWSAISNSSN